jgi:hypothetical protein
MWAATGAVLSLSAKQLILLVPGERIELPTNGLQNRCSTAELTRHLSLLISVLGSPSHGGETRSAAGLLPAALLPMK